MQALGTIDRPDQLAALSDEHRLALMRRLLCGPTTISRLGREFDKHPAWVRYHLKRLEAVGLIEPAGEVTTRNYTEKFYRATSGAFTIHMLIAPSTGDRSTVMVLGSPISSTPGDELNKVTFTPVGGKLTLAQVHLSSGVGFAVLAHKQAR